MYNSLLVVDWDGKCVHNYRKSHLFENDKLWCDNNDNKVGSYIDIYNSDNILLRMGLGICMDINPYEFKDYTKYELADYLYNNNCDGLILLCAWNDFEGVHCN